jgi:hypothetical protein
MAWNTPSIFPAIVAAIGAVVALLGVLYSSSKEEYSSSIRANLQYIDQEEQLKSLQNHQKEVAERLWKSLA